MKRTTSVIASLFLGISTLFAVDDNTVVVTFDGSTATVEIATNISNYVSDMSDGSSHVKLIQSASFNGNTIGEISYILSGSSDDGEFYLEGSYKCIVELNGLTLTNPSGPAINIQNGKRVEVSAKNGTVNTLTDGANEDYNGCYHCKGHTKFKGKGTLNIIGNSKHAIYSKEYVEMKNLTVNVTSAIKDGIHCKEYFLMEGGTLNISGVQDDGIQVELNGTVSTGVMADHEDEDSGNFYQEDGTITIADYNGKAIKADGSITFSGGKQNFDTEDITENAINGIEEILSSTNNGLQAVYDLNGRQRKANGRPQKGVFILRQTNKTTKIITK